MNEALEMQLLPALLVFPSHPFGSQIQKWPRLPEPNIGL
jgi:hypothetical protein